MKLYDLLDCLGESKIIILNEAINVDGDTFKFTKTSGDSRHSKSYIQYSINPTSVSPHSLIDIIKVKNNGLLGEYERGGQSNVSGLSGNIKRYFKKLSNLTRGVGDLGWDGGNVSKAMINLFQDKVVEFAKGDDILAPFDWESLITEYEYLIHKYVKAIDGAIQPTSTSVLPDGKTGVPMARYVAFLIVKDVLEQDFKLNRKLDTPEAVENYKNRVDKLGFLSDVDDTGGFRGAYEEDPNATSPDASNQRALDPFRM